MPRFLFLNGIATRRPNDVLYNHFIHFRTATKSSDKKSNGIEYHFVPVEGAETCFDIADISQITGVGQIELEFPHDWMTGGQLRDELLSAFGALNCKNHLPLGTLPPSVGSSRTGAKRHGF